MKLKQKKEDGEQDIYNHICSSNMESMMSGSLKEPCLSTEVSWMDIHEYFQEESSQKKQKKKGIILIFLIPVFTEIYFLQC